MKKLVLGLSLLGGLVFAQAQDTNVPQPPKGEKCQKCSHKKGEKSQEGHLDRMKQELNLSDKQVAQIKALHEKGQKEREQERTQQKEKFEQRRENHKKEMKKILTADQYKKWEEKMEKGKPENKSGQKRQHQNN